MTDLKDYGATERYIAEASMYPDWRLARVASQYRDMYRVVTEDGEKLARVSGKLIYETAAASDFPAVGDFVMASWESGEAVIHRVLRRFSSFERASAGGGAAQIVAANINTVFICMSLNENYNLSRLERYLAVAWSSAAAPVVVLTKADLCEDVPARIAEVTALAPGAEVIAVSRIDGESVAALRPYLKPGMTASFIGSSGVGKSTLINLLAGEELLATSEIGWEDKGRHTTTRRELLLLPEGGVVIDTPGMRELGLMSADVDASFSDISEIAARCRFPDCTHTNEPGCAVIAALEAGTLDTRRLESWRKLKREAAYARLNSRELEHEKIDAMCKDIGGMKNMRKFIRENNKRKR